MSADGVVDCRFHRAARGLRRGLGSVLVPFLFDLHDKLVHVAQCADRVVILGDGEVVVDGPTRRVMTSSMVFSSQVNKLLRDARFLTVDDVLSVYHPDGAEAGQ